MILGRSGEVWRDVGGGCGEVWRDVARCGEMWNVVRGWPVTHLVLDYVAVILDFVKFFVILGKNAFLEIFDRFSIDFR